MKRLNKKGYLTIEIVIASVITFVISFFLIDLTMKLVDTTDNAYMDTLLVTDKTLIINNIRKELENDMRINGGIANVECEENKSCTITLDNGTLRYLLIDDNNEVKYDNDINADGQIYSKKIHKGLSNLSISSSSGNGYYNFKIKGDSIFINEDYEMNINVYNQSVPILNQSNSWYKSTKYKKGDIDKIVFEDKVSSNINTATESWGAAEGLNENAITCYINEVDGEKILTIAGNGSGAIYANPNSSFLFGLGKSEPTDDAFLSLKTINNINLLNTSLVTNMQGLFANCVNLEEINLIKFDTSNVTNMMGMFYGCESAEEIIFQKNNNTITIDNFDTSNVTKMNAMFQKCSKLKKLDLRFFDTSNVTDMSFMFSYCKDLSELNLNSFDTGKVKNMQYMFARCSTLNYLNVSMFDTSNVTNMNALFFECINLQELNVSNFDTSNVTDMSWMFARLKVDSLNLTNFNTSNVINMGAMFHACGNLKELDLTNFDMSNVTITSVTGIGLVTGEEGMTGMFKNCANLITIYVSSDINLSNIMESTGMFENCFSLAGGSGTAYDNNKIDVEYARIDDPDNGKPGYFTLK